MNHTPRHTIVVTCAWWALGLTPAHAADAGIAAPDGRTTLRMAEDGATVPVVRRGETVIAAAPMGLDRDGALVKRVPAVWDETRFLQGEPGRGIVPALRQALAGGAAAVLEPLQ